MNEFSLRKETRKPNIFLEVYDLNKTSYDSHRERTNTFVQIKKKRDNLLVFRIKFSKCLIIEVLDNNKMSMVGILKVMKVEIKM